jgi:hypothetical protein
VEGGAIESVARSDEEARPQSVIAKDCESCTNPSLLQERIDAREFCLFMQTENGWPATRTDMTKTMHGDCGACSLQGSHAIPEFQIRRLSNEAGILIVWDDGDNG